MLKLVSKAKEQLRTDGNEKISNETLSGYTMTNIALVKFGDN